MAKLALVGVSKRYGNVVAAGDVSLSVGEGEFLALLGPSGCGKTTILRLIAGLTAPTAGEIHIGERCVNDLPPHRRGVGLVVQNYALFPHLTVFENVAYGLRVRQLSPRVITGRVRAVLDMVQLAGVERRYPRELSGGQQQRVALARALVIEPSVLLLDEALGALDRRLRQQMQLELKRLQRKLGVTTVYVTHDQEEALVLSDRIAVLDRGSVVEVAAPREIYEHPRDPRVAHFMGDANLLDGDVVGIEPDGLVVRTEDGQTLRARPQSFEIGDRVTLCIRPERMCLSSSPSDGYENAMFGQLDAQVYVGAIERYIIRTPDGARLIVDYSAASAPGQAAGTPTFVQWKAQDTIPFARSGPA